MDRLFKIQLIIMIFSVLNWHTETDIAVVGPLEHSTGDYKLAFEVMEGVHQSEAYFIKNNLPQDNQKTLIQFRINIKLDDPKSPVDTS